MKYVWITLVCAIAFLLAEQPVHANLIPWEFSWSRTPAELEADAPGLGKIYLTDQTATYVVSNSTVVATNLYTDTTASHLQPDRFTNKNYELVLTLKDLNSGQSGDLVFTGRMNGWLSIMGVQVANTFTGDMDQSIQLGNTLFRVHNFSYTPPSIPGATNRGSISAFVEVVEVLALPEPTTLVLAGMGVALVGSAGVRRVQRRRGAE